MKKKKNKVQINTKDEPDDEDRLVEFQELENNNNDDDISLPKEYQQGYF